MRPREGVRKSSLSFWLCRLSESEKGKENANNVEKKKVKIIPNIPPIWENATNVNISVSILWGFSSSRFMGGSGRRRLGNLPKVSELGTWIPVHSAQVPRAFSDPGHASLTFPAERCSLHTHAWIFNDTDTALFQWAFTKIHFYVSLLRTKMKTTKCNH